MRTMEGFEIQANPLEIKTNPFLEITPERVRQHERSDIGLETSTGVS